MNRLPATVLDSRVSGVGLMPGTLRDQIGDRATLLVFLRHFGCIFCREIVGDLRQASERTPDYPPVIFFFQDSPRAGRAFLRQYWPEARGVSDPEQAFYHAFGVERGSVLKMLGPRVLLSKRRATAKGYTSGPANGDIWMMPGVFLVRGDQVIWHHEFKHAAEQPEFDRIPEFARAGEAAAAPA